MFRRTYLCALVVCAVVFMSFGQQYPPRNGSNTTTMTTPPRVNTTTMTTPGSELISWEAYKEKFDKFYVTPEEEAYRMSIFMNNSFKIQAHNQLYYAGISSYRLGINIFSDLTLQEFLEQFTGGATWPPGRVTGIEAIDWRSFLKQDREIPPSKRKVYPQRFYYSRGKGVDLRERGCATEVKDQTGCSVCWAFAANSVAEYHYCNNKCGLVSFSEQELMDCADDYVNEPGCSGSGWYVEAWAYMKDKEGISSLEDYPWLIKDADCVKRYRHRMTNVAVLENINDENEMEHFIGVADLGPIGVIMNVTEDWQHYESGVLSNPSCLNMSLLGESDYKLYPHSVSVFGFGIEAHYVTGKEMDYWLVKNSWGGPGGYMKFERGVNMCGIALFPRGLRLDCEQKYDCDKHSPCTEENRKLNKYYFPSLRGRHYYVQCGISDSMCWIRPCPKKTRWSYSNPIFNHGI